MPLRIPRLAKAAAAISLASTPFIGMSMPALAQPASKAVLAGKTGSAPEYEWWLRTLHVVQAWHSVQGAGITVAVLSDGVTPGQSYLAGSVISGPDYTHSGRTASGPYFGVVGTGLASLIAGHGLGNYGAGRERDVSGVSPAVKVLSVRVTLSPRDPLWSNKRITTRLPGAIAAGIRYAVDHGASVIDLPADPGVHDPVYDTGSAAASGGSTAERAAVSYAISKNVLLVAPAGDNAQTGNAMNYPAAYPGVISVGAFGKTFMKTPYSARHRYVTLTAAGQDVVGANRTGFYTFESTCAASAIVTGIGALIRSEFPNLTVSQVRGAMIHSTVYRPKAGLADGSGYGTVDARRALTSAATMSPPHARPAMAGAAPRSRPVTPPVRSFSALIMRDLGGDAGLSGAALAVLLIPILLYGFLSRRREQQASALAAQRSESNWARPGHGTMLADPLLEFFGPQHARPIEQPPGTRQVVTPRFQPRPGLTGRSTMSGSLASRAGMPAAGAVAGQAPAVRHSPASPVTEAADSAAAVPAAAGAALPVRPVPAGFAASPTVRQAHVTGTPPWEPAQEPTSELPWAVLAAQPAGNRPAGHEAPPAIAPPPDSVWDSAPAQRSTVPGPQFQPAPIQPPWEDAVAVGPAQADPARRATPPASLPAQDQPGSEYGRAPADSERGPIFMWNPSAATDQFAAIDPASTDWQGLGQDRG